jgi:predicted aconitase
LSEDVWGELPKYQALMHAEQMKKEKQDLKNKRNMVRETLDKQMKDQAESRRRAQERAKEVDAMILGKAQAELEAERQKRALLKEKTL